MIIIVMLMKMVRMVMAIGKHEDNGDDHGDDVVDDITEQW